LNEQAAEVVEEASIERRVLRMKAGLEYVLHRLAFKVEDDRCGMLYYLLASTLADLEVKYKPEPGLVAETDGKTIFVGPLFEKVWEKYGDRVATAILLHEALHCIYAHPARIKLASDPELYNIVADLFVNSVLRKRFKIPLPGSFVTLESFVAHVQSVLGDRLTNEQRMALDKLARMIVDERVSVDKAYKVLLSIPPATKYAKEFFCRRAFMGKDLGSTGGEGVTGGGQVPATSGRRDAGKRPAGPHQGQGRAGHGAGDNTVWESLDDVVREGEEILRKLREAREAIERVLEKAYTALGEYQAIKYGGAPYRRAEVLGAPPGDLPGVFGYAEYEDMDVLTIKLEEEFLRDVGTVLGKRRITFAQYDGKVYWLPARLPYPAKGMMVLLDTSGSIPRKTAKMFTALVVKAVRAYNVVADTVVYAVGALAEIEITPTVARSVSLRRRLRIPLGGGTIWEKSIADRIRNAMRRGIRLLVVLSDFKIRVEPEVERELQWFKKAGGRVSCWSVTSAFLDICDFRHKLPHSPA